MNTDLRCTGLLWPNSNAQKVQWQRWHQGLIMYSCIIHYTSGLYIVPHHWTCRCVKVVQWDKMPHSTPCCLTCHLLTYIFIGTCVCCAFTCGTKVLTAEIWSIFLLRKIPVWQEINWVELWGWTDQNSDEMRNKMTFNPLKSMDWLLCCWWKCVSKTTFGRQYIFCTITSELECVLFTWYFRVHICLAFLSYLVDEKR